jgi:hypothetical protein
VYHDLRPLPSGYISKATILSNGHDFTSVLLLIIGTGGGVNSGEGCEGWDLRAQTGEHTASTLSSVISSSVVRLGQGASFLDDYYVGMTFVTLTGQAATISKYKGGVREAELTPAFRNLPAAGDGYGIAAVPLRVLYDPRNGVNWASQLSGTVTTGLACVCVHASILNFSSMVSLQGAGGCLTEYRCSLTLAQAAPAIDGIFNVETIYFSTGMQIGFTDTVMRGTPYLVSASHIATIVNGDCKPAPRGASYSIFLDDQSARVDAALSARHYFCEQLVGDNPPAAWIQVPFRKTFAFRSVPRIGSPATLTVAAEGRGFDDLLWTGNNITVTGEHGEFLHMLFEDGEMDKNQQDGGPITDTNTFSPEKMLEMTANRDIVLHFTTTSQARDGNLRFCFMKLSFTPAAFFSARAATDIFTDEDLSSPSGTRSADTDPALLPHNISVEFPLPAGLAGMPAGDAVFSVTVDGEMSEGFVEVRYGSAEGKFTMFRDWVWGQGALLFGLSEPANVGVSCDDSFVCTYNSAMYASASRTPRHTAVHRVARKEIKRFISETHKAPTASFVLRVLRTPYAKLSPVTLAYPLARCHMHTLSAVDSPLRQSLSRPNVARLTFVGPNAPATAGDATLWVSAEIQYHHQHLRDPIGLPSQVS